MLVQSAVSLGVGAGHRRAVNILGNPHLQTWKGFQLQNVDLRRWYL